MTLFFLSLNLFSFAQSGSAIVRSYAYYVESVRGNFPEYAEEEVFGGKVDSVRNIPRIIDTSIVIYIETKNKLISWDTAWQNGQAYHITAFPIEQTPVNAGIRKGGNTVLIKPAKGNFFWQLQLSPIRSSKTSPGKITRHEIILKGKYKGKKISWKTGTLIDLTPLPSV